MKNFEKWFREKEKINKMDKNILPKKRQIWWIKCGLNIGVEQDGKGDLYEKPVLVLKVFSRKSFLGIPITSKDKKNKRFFF